MSVREVIVRRGIESVVHFTTCHGFVGMLASEPQQVLPRALLESQEILRFLPCDNAEFRQDIEWLDYVNLSITNINRYFYKYSVGKHQGATWLILDFSPEILTHPDVLFVTTNNIYPAARRKGGPEGLEALFVPRFNNGKCDLDRERSGLPDNVPTCNQAEVLYRGPLSFEFLKKVHVKDEKDKVLVSSQADTLGALNCEVVISPERFLV